MDIDQQQPNTNQIETNEGGVDLDLKKVSVPGLRTLTTLHETIELVPEAEDASAPAVKARGKWHEKFARGR